MPAMNYFITCVKGIIPIFKADDLVYQSASLRLLAVGCFAVVASIELAIIQEQYLVKKTDGHKKNLAMKASEFIAEGAKVRPAVEEYNKSRFGPLTTLPISPFGNYYVYHFEGQIVGLYLYWDEGTAKTKRQAHIDLQMARLVVEILHPLSTVMEKWKEIAIMRFPHEHVTTSD